MTTVIAPPGSPARRLDSASTAPDAPHGSRWRRAVRGSEDDPRWMRPALLSLLVGTAVLYLWNLSASGNANSFYAAAVQAGSKSWKAWFFGSLDSSNFITVDKPPAALWVMGLSARVFGYNSWSLLVPQALEGVAAVALLVATVKRVASPRTALLSGAILALTPAAVLIFRFDNPDALLVLLLVAAAYCVTRALEAASTRWLMAAGVAIGFGFLTKSGQALLIVPALGLAYLVAAPTSVRRRICQLGLALAAIVVSCGWWLATVILWPAGDRPYIGGSTNNNPLELAFGYNGLSRLFGQSGGGGAGGGGGSGNSGFGGATGLARLFHSEMGLEISWLLPAALIGCAALVWLTFRAPRVDKTRAALIIWGGWLLTTAATFSFMKGTIHPYYTVALAPAIAAVLALAAEQLWTRRDAAARGVLAVMLVVSLAWDAHLLSVNDPSHATAVIAILAGMAALIGLVIVTLHAPRSRRLLTATALTALLAVGVPVSAWAVDTARTPHSGSIPTAVATSGSGGSGGGMGGGGTASTSSALVTALQATTTRWAAATVGSQDAATLELSSGKAVMALGGFSGTDPAPTLAQFKTWVAEGKIRYFIAGSGMGGGGGGFGGAGGGSSDTSAITTWVEAHFTKTTIGSQTVYDLKSAK